MREFFAALVSRLPPTWMGRFVLFALTVAVLWVFYTFGFAYSACRASGEAKAVCIITAGGKTYAAVWGKVLLTLYTILSAILP